MATYMWMSCRRSGYRTRGSCPIVCNMSSRLIKCIHLHYLYEMHAVNLQCGVCRLVSYLKLCNWFALNLIRESVYHLTKDCPWRTSGTALISASYDVSARRRVTGEPRHTRFRSLRVSVNTVTNIYTIPLDVPLKIASSAADYETKNF
jgi:hypothetical protein